MITVDDQVTQLSASFTYNKAAKERIALIARTAVARALADIGNKTNWSYLRRTCQINMIGAYSTGTIAYTAATRTVTLTGGTWPTNAQLCQILINRNVYTVQTRSSGTVLILAPGKCPTSDLASGTAYSLVQTTYTLPSDFVEMRGLVELERIWRVVYMRPEQMLLQTQLWFAPTNSWYFTILGAKGGLMSIQFAPPPITDKTWYMVYQARPRLPVMKAPYSAGTVAVTAGSTTVTVTGGTVPLTVSEGCVFRIGGTAVPTGLWGDNPYVEEHLVLTRTSDTVFELQTPVVTTTSGVRYMLDDPIDIEPSSQQTYFDRLCEAYVLRLHQAGRDAIADAERAAANAFYEARANDARTIPNANNEAPWMNLGEAIYWGSTP